MRTKQRGLSREKVKRIQMETLELEITEFLGEAKHKLRKSKGPNLFLTHTFEVERAVRIFSSKGKMGLFLLQNL